MPNYNRRASASEYSSSESNNHSTLGKSKSNFDQQSDPSIRSLSNLLIDFAQARHKTWEGSPTELFNRLKDSTVVLAKKKGLDPHFALMIKEICLLALLHFNPGDIVNSKLLCAEIRYGLPKDKPADGGNVPGLDEGERLNAGTVILLLADTNELPLKPLGPNTANLQQYRVKQTFGK